MTVGDLEEWWNTDAKKQTLCSIESLPHQGKFFPHIAHENEKTYISIIFDVCQIPFRAAALRSTSAKQACFVCGTN